ncbi:MAG: fasciclin domain-containing protein [Candidatus Marinimicrobia bacterium]|nr:fasciclin domain-containing protein [Candidatus Neomarinimicrobiota bacterium]
MRNVKFITSLCLVVLVLLACSPGGEQGSSGAAASFAKDHNQAGVKDDVSDPNILQIALGSPDHTTLVAGVVATHLENVLVGAGPLTVFAPTNAAFTKLPPGTLESLLKPENLSKLATIITSHASPGTFMGEGLKDGMQLYMATGQYVDVKVTDEGTFVNGSKILATIDATNGVVHVIDDVFLIAAG